MFMYVQLFPLVSSRFITIQMCTFELFLSTDSSLGRVDYSLLSDQTLMEMLFEGFDDEIKNKYKDNQGMYLDVCTWPCVTCGDHERVIEIQIARFSLNGSLELCYVPPKVKVLEIFVFSNRGLTGSIDLTRLPDGMEELNLRGHKLTGEVDLTQLPDGMNDLYLHNNQLTGEIDLTRLPDGMETLGLKNNQLTGEVDLTRLPDGMSELNLDNNNLTGEIDLTRIPEEMRELHIKNNQLSGSFVAKRVPRGMSTIDARGNNFNAIAVVDSKMHADIYLQESGVTSVVDENGKELDSKRFLEYSATNVDEMMKTIEFTDTDRF